MSPEARDHSFDELTRGLANGSISRRKALRLMGAALVGGALGSLGIREAAADPPGCKRNGKVCTKDKVCCSRICESGTCALCRSNGGSCSDNDQCCSGNCSSGTCAVNACVQQGGRPLTEGECTCAFYCPTNNGPIICQDNPFCSCRETTEGTGFCGYVACSCSVLKSCESSSECPSGSRCVVNGCCGGNVCLAPCSSGTCN